MLYKFKKLKVKTKNKITVSTEVPSPAKAATTAASVQKNNNNKTKNNIEWFVKLLKMFHSVKKKTSFTLKYKLDKHSNGNCLSQTHFSQESDLKLPKAKTKNSKEWFLKVHSVKEDKNFFAFTSKCNWVNLPMKIFLLEVNIFLKAT